MADAKQNGAPGTQPSAGDAGRGSTAEEAPGTARGEPGARQRTRRRRGGAAGAARPAAEAAVSPEGPSAKGMVEKAGETGRGLAGMAEDAAAEMRSLIGPPDLHPGGAGDAQEAMAKLVEGVMATNMRFADELLRRAEPSAAVELQRRFMREYFGALAQGGTSLLRAARQAADASARLQEGQARERGDAGSAEASGAVAGVMSKDVKLASPDDTVQQAARAMGDQGAGVLPVVGEDGRLVGVVTDRDLAVRALAAGKHPSETRLREVMSGGEPPFVFEDEAVEKAAAVMSERKVQRLPVLNRDQRVVGVVSLGDLARGAGS